MASERFLTLTDVAEVLNISMSQTYALVRNGDIEAIKIGGRGQYRVERDKLESYISRMYDETRKFLADHPFADAEADSTDSGATS
jgi:excisionase family DNA binding protein